MKFLRAAIFFVLVLSAFNQANSLHIIGGDVVYKCITRDTIRNEIEYEIIFTMYRDSRSGGAQFDNPANFGIYRGLAGSWRFERAISGIRVENVSDIDIATNNPCILVPVNVGVQRGVYTFNVRLPIINENYLIAYQRCCRNNTILNIVNPGGTGAAFTTEITSQAQKLCNNSPVFNQFPPVVICVNREINFDHSARDIDGDSLVYEFCAPVTAGGTDGATTPGSPTACSGVTPSPQNCPPPFQDVTFATPLFSPSAPMGGTPTVYLDSRSGLIGGIPTLLGQYVVGVCVREYRNGVLIGTLKRDFQFNVTTCEVAVKADLKAQLENNGQYNINSCGAFTIDFINLSTDVRFIQNYHWEFDIKGTKQVYNSRNVTVTFPGLGVYKATMILNKDLPAFAECSDTASITVNVYPSINTDYEFTHDTCVSGPITFKNKSKSDAGPIEKYFWRFDDEGISSIENPKFEFENPGLKTVRLIAEDANKCRDTTIKAINYFPVPSLVVIEPNTFTGCQPANIFFNNLSSPIDDTYKLDWDFGDGKTGNEFSPTHLYTDIGTYTVKLKITSPLKCETFKTWPSLIKVVPSPTAGFTFSPEEPNLLNNKVDFTDKSKDGVAFLWKFDSLGTSLVRNPTFTFRDTGTFKIEQIVLHPSGCSDTATAIIPIFPFVKLFMPNAFTPNNDGLNDIFIPVGSFIGIRNYNFTIWNRWGDRIFNTNETDVGWNGQRNNTGEVASPGVYAYLLEYIDVKGNQQILKGHCTLVR